MRKVNIEWYKKSLNLNEIYQQTGIKMSFVSAPKDGLKQSHVWVKCKDYLHDAVKCAVTGETINVYGFRYDPKVDPPIDLRRTRMLVTKAGLGSDKSAKNFGESLEESIKLLNHYETLAGVASSRLYEVQNNTGNSLKYAWLIVGPQMWLKAPYLVSLFSFLVRLGTKKLTFTQGNEKSVLEAYKALIASTKTTDNDVGYLNTPGVMGKISKIVLNHKKLIEREGKAAFDPMYFEDIKGRSMYFHNGAGFVSVCNGNYSGQPKAVSEMLSSIIKEEVNRGKEKADTH